MKVVIQGKNVEITDALHDYVHQKIERAVTHFAQLTSEVDVNLSIERNPRISDSQAAEVTVYANGAVIRAEESSQNMYASIDRVADKLHRKLRKFKERNGIHRTKSSPKTSVAVSQQPLTSAPDPEREPSLPAEVIRTKYFSMPAMSVSDALHNLEMIDHDFYVFRNAESNEINVIYERNHGGYGLIRPHKH
ncbi:MAG: ribosome-associated translation inhibitor RaiA [Cyanobacteria bacterium J06639_1]